jgi:integrase
MAPNRKGYRSRKESSSVRRQVAGGGDSDGRNNSYIRKHLGKVLLHELTPQVQQNFVTLSQKVSRKTALNIPGSLRSIVRTARSWGYCTQSIPTSELALPPDEIRKPTRFFSGEEARKIITAALDPYRTMFAIAAMTGLRAGEIIGFQKGISISADA